MPLRNAATISRVASESLAYLFDQISGKVYPFNFDKIENYKGQSSQELGLATGSLVSYDADNRGKITKVEVTPSSSLKKPRTFLVPAFSKKNSPQNNS